MQRLLLQKLVLPILVVTSVLTAATPISEVLGRYQNGTISVDYSLDIYWFVRERTSSRKGTLLFNQEGAYRVELGRHQWVCDGTEVWQYSKRKGMVTVYSLNRSPFESPKSLFAFLNSKSFTAIDSTNPLTTKAHWSSDDASSAYKEATITIDLGAKEVQEIVLVAQSGDRYTYQLIATNFSAVAGPNDFTFVIPKGVEVVEKR